MNQIIQGRKAITFIIREITFTYKFTKNKNWQCHDGSFFYYLIFIFSFFPNWLNKLVLISCAIKWKKKKMINLETGGEGDVSGRQPRISGKKVADGELVNLGRTSKNVIATPLDSVSSWRTRSSVHILSIIQGIQSKITTPFHPSSGVYQAVKEGLDVNGSRVLPPGSPKKRLNGALNRLQLGSSSDPAVVNNDSSVLVRVGSGLCSESVGPVGGVACKYVTVL